MSESRMDSHTVITYESPDLELFAKATNWKAYWASKVRPYINGSVIEVGAGIGTSTEYICTKKHSEWICLDPDQGHVTFLERKIARGLLPQFCRAENGVLADLPAEVCADTIIYIDVLEHIEDDQAEMRIAAAHLNRGGHVVVLSPAFNFLYSRFDRAVGHFRRYVKSDAERLRVPGLELRAIFYLDSFGIFLSLASRLFLMRSMPTAGQIKFWDKLIIPLSVRADRILSAAFGRTILMIWQKV